MASKQVDFGVCYTRQRLPNPLFFNFTIAKQILGNNDLLRNLEHSEQGSNHYPYPMYSGSGLGIPGIGFQKQPRPDIASAEQPYWQLSIFLVVGDLENGEQ